MSLEYDLPRTFNNFDEMREWVWNQFKRTEEEFNQGREAFYLKTLYEEPRKLKEGMIALASGFQGADPGWDPPGTGVSPGDNAGFYGYYGGAWHRLG